MVIASLDQIIAALPGQIKNCYKASATSEGAGTFHSSWKNAGTPGAGSNPPAYTSGSGYTPTDATTGAIPFNNPTGGNETRLAKLAATCSTMGVLILADRLWHCSGLTTNAITTLNITTPGTIASRDNDGTANGAGVELFGEVYTAPGATTASWTVSYTDQDGNTGQTATYTHPANAETVGQMFPFTLAAGDTGVRAVASFTTSAASGTAGDIGLTLLRRIATIPINLANFGVVLDAVQLGAPKIYDDSCLFWMWLCSTTNTGNILADFNLVQG